MSFERSIFWILTFFNFIITFYLKSKGVEDGILAKHFFLILAISYFILASENTNPKWIKYWLLEQTLYNVIKEIRGRGSELDYYDVYFSIVFLVFTYLYYNYKNLWKQSLQFYQNLFYSEPK